MKDMDNIDQFSFEEALLELEKTLEQLEQESLTLECALALYQRGGQLAKHCQSLLDAADQRLEILNHTEE